MHVIGLKGGAVRPLSFIFLAKFSPMADLSGLRCIFVNETTEFGQIFDKKGVIFQEAVTLSIVLVAPIYFLCAKVPW